MSISFRIIVCFHIRVAGKMLRKECCDRDLSKEAIELRACKVTLDTGEEEVLLTNLYDCKQWPVGDFKLDKSRMEIERWSGKSVRCREQDFYGRMLLATLSACLASVAEHPLLLPPPSRMEKITMASKFWNCVQQMFLKPLKGIHPKHL